MSGPRPIREVASRLELPPESVVEWGRGRAKVDHRLAARAPRPGARYVLVTAITPTPLGEGKTVTTIGLAMALERLGERAVCTLRQPSLGPVFGLKGGGTGGGASRVVPSQDIDLHLTGDAHAVTAAANLLAAAVDTSILLDNPLHIDPEAVTWRRTVDLNDRALRRVRVGLGGPRNGIPRDAEFEIAGASEVMGVLALSRDLDDLARRLAALVVGRSLSGKLVTAADLRADGALSALLREALDPNLVQTCEGTPALVHTGPFANVSVGSSSVVADLLAASCADWVVTEAGFGADMGAEKFFHLKCRASGLRPSAAVLVASVRGLKAHSGRFAVRAGEPPPPELAREDLDALAEGSENLRAQVENLAAFGVPVVVALNHFEGDGASELELVAERALEAGAREVAVSRVHAEGGAGGLELAAALMRAAAGGPAEPVRLYADSDGLREKACVLATRLYGAESVRFSPRALDELQRLEAEGFGGLPVCMAKTQHSLSHDPALRGRPRGFVFPVRSARLCAGAGFVVMEAGTITTMPGMGRDPAYRRIGLGPGGAVRGL